MRHAGIWVLAASGALGLLFCLRSYFSVDSGIDHTVGALLVIASSALLLATAPILGVARLPRFVARTLFVLLFLDLAGTSIAGYFLEAWSLLLAMGLGFAGWFFHLLNKK